MPVTARPLPPTVVWTRQWRQDHVPHLDVSQAFATEPYPHPSGTWFWLVCPCGAKHLCDGPEDDR